MLVTAMIHGLRLVLVSVEVVSVGVALSKDRHGQLQRQGINREIVDTIVVRCTTCNDIPALAVPT